MNPTAKDNLAQNVKQWLVLEKEIIVLQKELKERKKKKLLLSNALIHIMKSKEIDCLDINNGKIIYTQTRSKNPINKSYLLQSLSQYFINKPNVPTEEIVKFIMEKREVVTKDGIKHKPVK